MGGPRGVRQSQAERRLSYKPDHGRLVMLGIMAGLGGLWSLVNGIMDIVRPDTEHESVSDLED